MARVFPQSIAPSEILPARPFTHPDHIPVEEKIVSYMLQRVCMFLERHLNISRISDPVMLPESDGRSHRYIIPRPALAAAAKPLALVGFFGQKRLDARPDHFGSLVDRLINGLHTFPDILSYTTMALPGGNFSNLVLLKHTAVKQPWMAGKAHKKAVERSPGYYRSVRIYNGMLPDGVMAPGSVRLMKVKYFDYECNPPWRGDRSLV